MDAHSALKMEIGRRNYFVSAHMMNAQILQLSICWQTTPYGMLQSYLKYDVIENFDSSLLRWNSLVNVYMCLKVEPLYQCNKNLLMTKAENAKIWTEKKKKNELHECGWIVVVIWSKNNCKLLLVAWKK